VVEGARLESEAGQPHGFTSTRLNAHAISDLASQNDHPVCVRKPRCESRFWGPRITVLSQSVFSLGAIHERPPGHDPGRLLCTCRQPTAPRGQFSQRTRMGTANKLSPNRTADAPS
jgi:hypothetical protein